MRSLQKIIDIMQKEDKMEYDSFLEEVKSVIEYCDRNYKKFSQMQFRSGNETILNDLTRDFQLLLIKYNYIDDERFKPLPSAKNQLQKFTLFLLLNVDLNFKYDLKNDAEIAHIAGICPLMPVYLACAIMWTLQMDKYLYEALSYSPAWFSFRFFEFAADSLSFIRDPFDVLEKANNLIQSILKCCARTEMRLINDVDKKCTFNRLYDYAMTILRQFYTPDAQKMSNFSNARRQKYLGYAIKNVLEMAHFAIDLHEEPALAKPRSIHDIYEICSEQCKIVEFHASQHLKDQLLKIIFAILNSLQYNIMLVTVGIFMSWCEYDLNEDDTLQSAIGRMSYSLKERIDANTIYTHDVIAQLSIIGLKPKTFKEVADSANIGQILRKLDDETLLLETHKLWMDELFSRSLTLSSEECIESIRKHITLIRYKHIAKILEFLAMNIEMEERMDDYDFDTKDEVKSLLLEGIKHLDWTELMSSFECQTKIFGKMTKVCEMDGFEERATQFFNTLTTTLPEEGFKSLCFENPSEIWLKFFQIAHYNRDMIDLFCNAVKNYQTHAKLYLHEILTNALRDENKMQEKYFPNLIAELYFSQFVPNKKTMFLDDYLTTCIDYHKINCNYNALTTVVKILYIIAQRKDAQTLRHKNVTEFAAPVFLLVGQIMDYARWDFVTYAVERDVLVQECIKFLQKNIGKFLPNALPKDRMWISKFAKSLTKPQTKFYYQKFHISEGEAELPFDEYMIPSDIVNPVELEKLLFAQLARCTSREIVWLARGNRLKPLMKKVMINFGAVASNEHDENQLNIYRNALLGWDSALRAIYMDDVKGGQIEGTELLLDALEIIKASPANIYDEVFMNFQNLLLEIIDICRHPWIAREHSKCKRFLASMQECNAREKILENLEMVFVDHDLCEDCDGHCEDSDAVHEGINYEDEFEEENQIENNGSVYIEDDDSVMADDHAAALQNNLHIFDQNAIDDSSMSEDDNASSEELN